MKGINEIIGDSRQILFPVARKALAFSGNVDDVTVCLLHDSYEDFDGDRDVFAEQINNEFGEDMTIEHKYRALHRTNKGKTF